MDPNTAFFTIGGLFGIAAWIWFLVLAFRVSLGWGLLVFFLGWTWIPLIIFAVRYWKDAKRPLTLSAFGFVIISASIAMAFYDLDFDLDSIREEPDRSAAQTGMEAEPEDHALPTPRPAAQPTHPSWEAVVKEIDPDNDGSWEKLVPSPTPVTGRPSKGRLTWDESADHIGRTVVLELDNNTIVTAALEAVESDRLRIRHNIGGGEASYWIEREQVSLIRLAN